jgi:uncharacterized OsmC-like protein
MVKVSLRDKNQLITLECLGKVPIRGRASSTYFHSPLDLLLSSIGLCIGGTIVNYCRLNNLNVAQFEEVQVLYQEEKFIILIKRPQDFLQEHQDQLTRDISACNISRELKKELQVRWEYNTIPLQELLKEPSKGCCQ